LHQANIFVAAFAGRSQLDVDDYESLLSAFDPKKLLSYARRRKNDVGVQGEVATLDSLPHRALSAFRLHDIEDCCESKHYNQARKAIDLYPGAVRSFC
jgi:hypothetical protein